MCVLFSDIRSFTALSEKMSPQEAFNFINAYFGRIGPVIRRSGGFIDKYIGDAIMALFPGEPASSVEAALGIQRELRKFNVELRAAGREALAAGVGIHYGSLSLGTVGEADRMDSTVIGDMVNLACRLDGMESRASWRSNIPRA